MSFYVNTDYSVETVSVSNGAMEQRSDKPREMEINGRILYLDTDYIRSEEGIMKVIELSFVFLALILSSCVYGVQGERGFAMLVCFFAFLLTVAILIGKVLTLNRQLTPRQWLVMEAAVNGFLIVAFLIAAVLMAVICAAHWALINPKWQTLPSFAAGVLVACGICYAIDTVFLYKHRSYRTWIPDVSTYKI